MEKGIISIGGDWISNNIYLLMEKVGTIGSTICLTIAVVWYAEYIKLLEEASEVFDFVAFLSSHWAVYSTVAFFGLYIVGSILYFKENNNNKKTIKTLELEEFKAQERSTILRFELDYEQQIATQLRSEHEKVLNDLISEHLRLMFHNGLKLESSERVSLYYHDGKKFIIVARYSDSPDYKKINRRFFPDNQGIISNAWKNKGKQYKEFKELNTNKYFTTCKVEFGLEKETVEKLSMPSKCMSASVIKDYSQKRIGVVVLESELLTKYRSVKGEINKLIKNNKENLITYIEAFKTVDTTVYAKKKEV